MSEYATEVSEYASEAAELSPKQLIAITELLTNGTVTAAAKAAGVDRSTIYRWQNEPAFKLAMLALEQETVRTLTWAIHSLGDAAHAALLAALDPKQPMNTRLKASQIVFDNMMKLALAKVNAPKPVDTSLEDEWWEAAGGYDPELEAKIERGVTHYNSLSPHQKDDYWHRVKE